ncbi:MAG: cystathionine beta-synthase [Halobacteriovoraceae bacterium]|nr:cystathionine beta-synthase [Halobacteriovoraceae bacterium]|tara:strand:- start:2257 stop:3300 length:1044 start_codon:yes stop_codon:yes gene_type:complete
MKNFQNTNIISAIGNTPIIRLQSIDKEVESEIYVKLEYLNPGGSIKDRMGVYMCEKAVENGDIAPGGTFIECTSGNTGVGIALYANTHGYKCIFVMADKQSKEKIDSLKAFGAKVIVCPTNVEPEDPRSYYSVAASLKSLPNSFHINQYENIYNSECHYLQTAPEIYEQTKGEFDTFMAAVGTGGTISGIGKYLKEKMPKVKIVGVDCKGSILAHYKATGEMGEAHSYVLEGIGEDFLPGNVHFDVIDDFVVVEDEESFQMTRRLVKEEGVYAGGSCGAAVLGALKYAKKLDKPEKILLVLHDGGSKYASKIYNDAWMLEKNYHVDNSQDETDKAILDIIKDNGKLA